LPEDYIENGKIILNLRPQAVDALSLGNEAIEFNARFGGKAMLVSVSVNAVMAIYAKENGKGLVFDQEDGNEIEPTLEQNQPSTKPSLRIVK
jgi:stringent starvation protein B